MAAAQLIATGNTLANSADFDVVAGAPVTVGLKDADAAAEVRIQLKADGGTYVYIASLTAGALVLCIQAPGTYRLLRPASSGACGAFRA